LSKTHVLFKVLKNFLILILIESSLHSWILSLEPWILILVFRLSSWVLNSSWFLSWTLELFLIHLSCSLIDLWAFCHHFCHHLLLSSLLSSKHLWITFDSPWSFASTWFTILVFCSPYSSNLCFFSQKKPCFGLIVRSLDSPKGIIALEFRGTNLINNNHWSSALVLVRFLPKNLHLLIDGDYIVVLSFFFNQSLLWDQLHATFWSLEILDA